MFVQKTLARPGQARNMSPLPTRDKAGTQLSRRNSRLSGPDWILMIPWLREFSCPIQRVGKEPTEYILYASVFHVFPNLILTKTLKGYPFYRGRNRGQRRLIQQGRGRRELEPSLPSSTALMQLPKVRKLLK